MLVKTRPWHDIRLYWLVHGFRYLKLKSWWILSPRILDPPNLGIDRMSLPKAVGVWEPAGGGRWEVGSREASERLGCDFWVKEVSTSKSKQKAGGGKSVMFFLKKKSGRKNRKANRCSFHITFSEKSNRTFGICKSPKYHQKIRGEKSRTLKSWPRAQPSWAIQSCWIAELFRRWLECTR